MFSFNVEKVLECKHDALNSWCVVRLGREMMDATTGREKSCSIARALCAVVCLQLCELVVNNDE